MTIFLPGRQRTGALCVQHSPTAAALSTNTAFEWKMWFSCFPVLPCSAEAQVIWGGILKHLLIAYFIGNISAQKHQILFMCVKVITSNSWDVFLRHGVFSNGAGTDIRWSGGLCMRFLGTVMWIATFSVCRPNFIAIFTYNLHSHVTVYHCAQLSYTQHSTEQFW